jgi:hypothetical protein
VGAGASVGVGVGASVGVGEGESEGEGVRVYILPGVGHGWSGPPMLLSLALHRLVCSGVEHYHAAALCQRVLEKSRKQSIKIT